ncbi:uncharacterized protein LOC113293465 [Papaver somniferum]|uniref:uncharacterized protein LOC113293465 n=1 Tax=Papaver somniferum TaxID=3469 RepID=UPI000E6FDD9D|nr:uncharacterized protein LOC113293465 [Papaver somniferum]
MSYIRKKMKKVRGFAALVGGDLVDGGGSLTAKLAVLQLLALWVDVGENADSECGRVGMVLCKVNNLVKLVLNALLPPFLEVLVPFLEHLVVERRSLLVKLFLSTLIQTPWLMLVLEKEEMRWLSLCKGITS